MARISEVGDGEENAWTNIGQALGLFALVIREVTSANIPDRLEQEDGFEDACVRICIRDQHHRLGANRIEGFGRNAHVALAVRESATLQLHEIEPEMWRQGFCYGPA